MEFYIFATIFKEKLIIILLKKNILTNYNQHPLLFSIIESNPKSEVLIPINAIIDKILLHT
jgi:hypothetical protein